MHQSEEVGGALPKCVLPPPPFFFLTLGRLSAAEGKKKHRQNEEAGPLRRTEGSSNRRPPPLRGPVPRWAGLAGCSANGGAGWPELELAVVGRVSVRGAAGEVNDDGGGGGGGGGRRGEGAPLGAERRRRLGRGFGGERSRGHSVREGAGVRRGRPEGAADPGLPPANAAAAGARAFHAAPARMEADSAVAAAAGAAAAAAAMEERR